MTISVDRVLADCRDFGFKDQITRSILSVPSNIAEGSERLSDRETRRFFDIAKGSLGEFKAQADIGMAIGFISEEVGSAWLAESEELSKMLAALIKKYSS